MAFPLTGSPLSAAGVRTVTPPLFPVAHISESRVWTRAMLTYNRSMQAHVVTPPLFPVRRIGPVGRVWSAVALLADLPPVPTTGQLWPPPGI